MREEFRGWIAGLWGPANGSLEDGAAWEEQREEIDIDGLGSTEEIEKDFDAFGCRGDGDDGAFQSAEGSAGDLDFVAGFDGGREGDDRFAGVFLIADFLAEAVDEGTGNGRDLVAKADESADALGEGDGAFHFGEVEAGEEVAGKQRFDPPDLAAAGGFAVAEAGAEGFDAFEFDEAGGGDVFALGLRADAIPFGLCGVGHGRLLTEEALDDRQDAATGVHPVAEAGDAIEQEIAVGGVWLGFGSLLKFGEFGFAAFEVGADLFADEPADEAFEFDGGFVVGSATVDGQSFADGAEVLERAEALADGAFADAQAGDEVVEREGLRGDEQEAVDFAERAGQTEDLDSVDKEIDHLALESVKLSGFHDFRVRRQVHGAF